jgi:capsular exopolysaccharide synthesis family protein
MTEKLGQLEDQRLAELQVKNREDANTAYANTQHGLFQVEEQLRRTEAALADQEGLLFQYQQIEAEILENAERRLQLNNYITNLERIVRQRSAISVNIAQPATDPLQRSSPSFLLLPLSLFVAAAVALGAVLGLELMDKSVRTTQDIARFLGLPLLGVVPHTDDEEVAIERIETAARDAPRSMVAEAFRRIRTSLQFSAPALRRRTVLVTGSRPEAGTTSVACNLAVAVAQGGQRVLLVDANFRRPGVPRNFGSTHPQGLSNILVGDGSLETYVTGTNVARLDILAGGPAPPNPVELLGGEACRAFLQTAASTYDQVIVDAAPVLVASDALVLAPAVDGVILVVRAKESSRGASRRACNLLSEVGAHFFGAVLNAAQIARGGYFREQLRTYYEYQEPPAR